MRKCRRCGSKFELSEHHDRQKHLSRNSKTDHHTVTLCATCHHFADFDKNLACYHKARLKWYNKKMDRLFPLIQGVKHK